MVLLKIEKAKLQPFQILLIGYHLPNNLRYAKNYGDAEKIISDEVEINYVHHALSQPNDIPSSLLLSYSQVEIEKDIQILKKETPSSEEYPAQEGATTRSKSKSKLLVKSSCGNFKLSNIFVSSAPIEDNKASCQIFRDSNKSSTL
jgi:hypothetical protein